MLPQMAGPGVKNKQMEVIQNVALPLKKLPVFIVGAGGIVRDGHLPAYRKAGFPVCGICDLDRRKSEDLQRSFPEVETIYDSLDEFVALHREEVVYDLALPAKAIIPSLKKLPQGASVLIQKPMGEDLSDA